MSDTFVRVNTLNIHLQSAGKGKPLVLIHGFMGMAFDWRFNITELGKHFSVFAMDLPGFGLSDKPLDFDYSSKGYADFITSFIDVLNVHKVALIGNSMGGQIALMTALEYPGCVSELVLVDSGGYPQSVEFKPFKMLNIPVIGEISMALLNRNIIRIMLREGIYYDASIVTDEIVRTYSSVYDTPNARKIPPLVIRSIMKDESYIASRLNEIKCPALVIWGAEDKVISPTRADMFRQDISQASLLLVQKSGHMPQVEKPDVVNKAIIQFLSART